MESKPPANNQNKPPTFEVVQKREGINQYVFPHVLITINSTQEAKRGAPELVYATFDRIVEEASLDRPAYKRPGVDIDYVVQCIKAVTESIKETRFWVSPYNEDSLGAAKRVEQWNRYFSSVEPAPENGFYLYI